MKEVSIGKDNNELIIKFSPLIPQPPYVEKKCEKCGIETDNIVWVKNFTYVCKYSQKTLIEVEQEGGGTIIEYGRDQLLKILKDDIKNNKNKGERYYCESCSDKVYLK